MSAHPSAPGDAACDDDAPDPAVLRAERRLAVLAELTEIGMELARALSPSASADAGEVAAAAGAARRGRRDPAEAFGGLSRAIRLTVMLAVKADEALRDLQAGVVRAPETARERIAEEAREAPARARREREDQIRGLILEVAEERIADKADRESLDEALEDWQLDHEAFGTDPARPLREIIEHLCDYLDLTPDWSRWQGDRWAPPDRPPAWPWSAETRPPPEPPPPPARRAALAADGVRDPP